MYKHYATIEQEAKLVLSKLDSAIKLQQSIIVQHQSMIGKVAKPKIVINASYLDTPTEQAPPQLVQQQVPDVDLDQIKAVEYVEDDAEAEDLMELQENLSEMVEVMAQLQEVAKLQHDQVELFKQNAERANEKVGEAKQDIKEAVKIQSSTTSQKFAMFVGGVGLVTGVLSSGVVPGLVLGTVGYFAGSMVGNKAMDSVEEASGINDIKDAKQ